MPTQKTFTVADIEIKQVTVRKINHPENGVLFVARADYVFLDAQGDPVVDMAPRSFNSPTFKEADAPAGIKSALQTVETYLYNQAIKTEDMEDT